MLLLMTCLGLLRTVKSVNLPITTELYSILEDLKLDTKVILKWFRINSLKDNSGKFQFMILGKKNNVIK